MSQLGKIGSISLPYLASYFAFVSLRPPAKRPRGPSFCFASIIPILCLYPPKNLLPRWALIVFALLEFHALASVAAGRPSLVQSIYLHLHSYRQSFGNRNIRRKPCFCWYSYLIATPDMNFGRNPYSALFPGNGPSLSTFAWAGPGHPIRSSGGVVQLLFVHREWSSCCRYPWFSVHSCHLVFHFVEFGSLQKELVCCQ